MITSLIIASFALPLAGALSSFVSASSDESIRITYGAYALGGLSALAVAIGSFVGPFAGALAPLQAFFFGIIGAGTFLASLYAIGYIPLYRESYASAWHASAFALFLIGMQAVVLSPSVLVFLIAWELMSISGYFLVISERTPDAFRAGLEYIIMTQLGFAAISSGMLLLAGGAPFASWQEVAASAAQLSGAARGVAFVLLLAGFGSKAGLVPLHQWLPQAHSQAPSHASALLSGVMLKVALFGFILTASLFPGIPLALSALVIVLGLISAFFGALHAAVEDDLKRLLAWSSIENLGLIFSGVGAVLLLGSLPQSPLVAAMEAGMLTFVIMHTLNHAFMKLSLFLSAGTIVAKTHTRDLDALGGLAAAWPFFSGVVLALALAASALPPFGTFFGEWAYLQALVLGLSAPLPAAIAAALVLGIIGLVGGLAAFAFVKMYSAVFLGRARTEHAAHAINADRPSLLLVVSPALGVLALLSTGLFVLPLLAAQGGGVTAHVLFASTVLASGMVMNAWLVLTLLGGALLIAFLAVRAFSSARGARVTGTWDCGTPLSPRMEQTATGFAAPIRFFFRSIVLAEKEVVAEPVVATNPWIAKRQILWSVDSFWERYAYRPVTAVVCRTARTMRRMQNGVMQSYLLFMFIALIVVLIVAAI
ncbi:MAG TPA: proton-conducting transporter membrane subunit [Candidatus Paceibacterota bacterium]